MTRALRKNRKATIFQILAAAEHQKANAQPGELHYGHLEAISFLRAREEFGHFRRYEAHLDRAYQKALAEFEKLASLRTDKQAEPLPPPQATGTAGKSTTWTLRPETHRSRKRPAH